MTTNLTEQFQNVRKDLTYQRMKQNTYKKVCKTLTLPQIAQITFKTVRDALNYQNIM